jgi:phosphate transport system substrate-binding protein
MKPSSFFRVALTMATFALASVAGPLASANEPVRISGTGSGTGGMQLVAQAFMQAKPGTQVTVLPALGSAGGISALLAGRIDLAVANRAPNDKERQETLDAREYARTPFVPHSSKLRVRTSPRCTLTPWPRCKRANAPGRFCV